MILQFYSGFKECEKVMLRLNTQTNALWKNYNTAFKNALPRKAGDRSVMEYTKEFDHNFTDIIEKNQNYKIYQFKIELNSLKSIKKF